MTRILLVRHGQASWGAADYDRLSDLGGRQSRALGAALAGRGVTPTLLVAGAMRRHAQTAEAAADAAGWATTVTVDEGWNEFDHLQVLARHPAPEGVGMGTEPRVFQAWFEEATERWTAGAHDDYEESFAAFTGRVDAALDRVAASARAAGPGGTAVVFTSGGPIAWAATSRLAGDAALWRRLNRITVNSSVTGFVVGGLGVTLITLNEHVHLVPGDITYR